MPMGESRIRENVREDGRHENYEILNLLGYGLAKFEGFAEAVGFPNKSAFTVIL